MEQDILKPSVPMKKASPAKMSCSLLSSTDSEDGLQYAPSNFFVYISLASVTLEMYTGIFLHNCSILQSKLFLFQMSLYKFPIRSVIRYNVI